MKLVSPEIDTYCQTHCLQISENLLDLAQQAHAEFDFSLMMAGRDGKKHL